MAFPSSVSFYLDPSTWQQQQQSLSTENGSGNNDRAIPPHPGGGNDGGNNNMMGSTSSAVRKANSMAEKARQAKIPQPEAALKCPRCESTNTKFCYFNNYNLSQPRHFCKTCRRYWTRGGALRTVPVGGGCRRNNKRTNKSKRTSSSSKSPQGVGGDSCYDTSTTSAYVPTSTSTTSIHHHQLNLGQLPPLLPPLQHMHLGGYGNDMGLNFTGLLPSPANAPGSGVGSMLRMHQQNHHQLPFFASLDQQQSSGVLYEPSSARSEKLESAAAGNSLLMSRNFLGKFMSSSSSGGDHSNDNNDDQEMYSWQPPSSNNYDGWISNTAVDATLPPGFTSPSSTSHLL